MTSVAVPPSGPAGRAHRGVGILGAPPMEPICPPAVYLWPDLSDLPMAKEENPKLRGAYTAHYSYQPVGARIDELAAWFDILKP